MRRFGILLLFVLLNPFATAKEEAPHPGSARFRTVTGGAGVARGRFNDIHKTCNYLCGDEAQECRYVGLFALDKPVEAIGRPLAALPGHHALSGFRSLSAEAAQPEATFPPAAIGRDFAPLAWTPHGVEGPVMRITGSDTVERALMLESRWRSGDSFSVEAPECRARRAGDLTELQCNGVALILDAGAPLLFSWPDYNTAAAEIVATLQSGGSTLYLVRLELKA